MHNIKSSEELVNLIEEKVVRGEMEAGLGPWVVLGESREYRGRIPRVVLADEQKLIIK